MGRRDDNDKMGDFLAELQGQNKKMAINIYSVVIYLQYGVKQTPKNTDNIS